MRYGLVNVVDNMWASGPYEDAAPVVPDGQRLINVPAGFPTRCHWSADANGFLDNVAATAEPLAVVDFMLLFTPTEFLAAKARRSSDPQVDYFWSLLEASTNGVRLAHPALVNGVDYLVSAGLLTADRAAQILAGNPPA